MPEIVWIIEPFAYICNVVSISANLFFSPHQVWNLFLKFCSGDEVIMHQWIKTLFVKILQKINSLFPAMLQFSTLVTMPWGPLPKFSLQKEHWIRIKNIGNLFPGKRPEWFDILQSTPSKNILCMRHEESNLSVIRYCDYIAFTVASYHLLNNLTKMFMHVQ